VVSLGLDLRGGAHLALELDQSERVSSDPAGDIDLALAIMRKRVDEFGVREPLVQKSGSDRIVIELPGLVDLERAKAIIRRTAYLEFRITDESGGLDKALPGMDRALQSGGAILSALIQSAAAAGPGGIPGEYVVAEADWSRVDSLLKLEPVKRLQPRGVELKWSADPGGPPGSQYRYLYALEDRPIITGSSLIDARAQIDPITGAAEVVFEVDRPGGPQVRAGDGQARQRLHGDPARRQSPG
jgi:preprotein translocase subunit SecD